MDLRQIKETCDSFFLKYEASVKVLYFKNVEIVKEHNLQLVYLIVSFRNSNFFGDDEFYKGVYQRYRHLKYQLIKELTDLGLRHGYEPGSTFIEYIPVIDENSYLGSPLQLNNSRDPVIHPLDVVELSTQDKQKMNYVREIPEVTTRLQKVEDGKYYQIDVGNIIGFISCCESLDKIKTIIDIGAGSGNIARIALNRYEPDKLILVDNDERVCRYLKAEFDKKVSEKDTQIEVYCMNSINFKLPEKFDIFSMSVNKEVIISYIHKNRVELSSNLIPDGMAIYQLASIATVFWSAVFDSYVEEIQQWPWYQHITSIRSIYRHVFSFRLGYDLIYLCSNELKCINKAKKKIRAIGGECYEVFEGWTRLVD